MKKVLIFSLAYYPHVGGAEVAIKEITDRIDDIEFHMLTMRFSTADKTYEKVGQVHIHRIGEGASYFSKMLFVLRAAKAARSLHAQERFNACWAMMSYMTLPIVFSGLGVPYALTLQEGDTYEHMFSRVRVLPFIPFINKGFRGAAVVQSISTYLGSWARRRGFEGPLEVVPNGVDVEKFNAEKVPHEGVVLITTSRLVHKNAVDDIIKALPDIPHVTLQVLGVGPDEQKLKELAKKLGVSERVVWEGYIEHAQLPFYLHRADIFIRPSRSEGMGNSFVEAMAAGLPVVATREGGLSDFIVDEETAFVVEKNSPEQIARVVTRILDEKELVREVAERGRKLAHEKYDWRLIARTMRSKVFGVIL